MEPSALRESLESLELEPRALQRDIASLGRKKVPKDLPYDVTLTVLAYLYGKEDKDSFVRIYEAFVSENIDDHFAEPHRRWSFVVGLIVLNSSLTGDKRHVPLIREKGFVEERLQGSMLELHASNLAIELSTEEKGQPLPIGTIIFRYRELMLESLVMLEMCETTPAKSLRIRLERYKKLFVAAIDNASLKGQKFIEALQSASKELV